MEGIIDKLVQLNQANGAADHDVGLLVSQVTQSVRDNQVNFSSFTEAVKVNCENALTLYTTFGKKIQSQISQLNSDINRAESDNESVRLQGAGHLSSLQSNQQLLKQTQEEIRNALQNLAQYGSEAEQKLVVVKALRDIITDELMAEQKYRPNYQQTSFVQLKTFGIKLKELKNMLTNSKERNFTPMVGALLELVEGKGFADQKVLQQVISLLAKLSQNLNDFRNKQESEDKKNIANLKSKVESVTGQIRSTADLIYQGKGQMMTNQSTIDSAKKSIQTLTQESARNGDMASNYTKMCAGQKAFIDAQNNYVDTMAEKLQEVTATLLR